jgi:hypothetical protein
MLKEMYAHRYSNILATLFEDKTAIFVDFILESKWWFKSSYLNDTVYHIYLRILNGTYSIVL